MRSDAVSLYGRYAMRQVCATVILPQRLLALLRAGPLLGAWGLGLADRRGRRTNRPGAQASYMGFVDRRHLLTEGLRAAGRGHTGADGGHSWRFRSTIFPFSLSPEWASTHDHSHGWMAALRLLLSQHAAAVRFAES